MSMLLMFDTDPDPPINYYRINGHGHILPTPEEIPRFMKDRELFWISDDRRFMHQKGWSRPIDSEIFFVEHRMPWLQKYEINHEVILNLSQLYANELSGQTLQDVIRFQNDFNDSLQDRYPTWFTTGFVVQAGDIDFALKEIERCAGDKKMPLLCLPTHFMQADGQWRSIFCEHTKPIFELANEYKLAIEIHPYDGQKIIQLDDRFWRFHIVWMCAQTADAYHMCTMLNFHKCYPNVRYCFAHGNQFGQINYGRRKQGFRGRPDLFEGAFDPDEAIQAPTLFFDTLMHDHLAFELTVRRQGPSSLIAGLDDPYPLGEVDTVDESYPGKIMDQAVASGIITTEDRRHMWGRNVLNWLAGEDHQKILKRIGITENDIS